MNKKLLYTLSILIGFILVISTCILIANKIITEYSTMAVRLKEYEEKSNVLEERIVEYQKLNTEMNSFNISLQELLDQANMANRVLEGQVTENNSNIEGRKNFYGNFQGNDDFSDIINVNPIDKDYQIEFDEMQKSTNSTTLEWTALEVKYTEKWQEEVDAALELINKSLSEQDSVDLNQSMKSWQSFIDDDLKFVYDKFIITGYYGSQGKVQIQRLLLNRTRARAIELMEYIFSLDRTAVDFVYDN